MRKYLRLLIVGVISVFLASGCTVSEVIHAETSNLDVASLQISESLLLDVGILNFDSGVPEDNDAEKTRIYPEVRSAEARYIPFHIKTTLQGTGFWGAVRVIPTSQVSTDVLITGVIEESDGEFAVLRLNAQDATGRHWLEKTYSMQTGISSYADYRDRTQDPYQKLFNDFANDLHAYALTIDPKDIARIRQVSELKFFADMVPDVYTDYLQSGDDGRVSAQRLPAENDPMVDRLRQIRERDRLVVDTLNEHYANFYYGIALPYEGWRKRTREQSVAYRQSRQAAIRKALIGAAVVVGSATVNTDSSYYDPGRIAQSVAINKGWNTIVNSFSQYRSASVHREEIKELSESFVAEAAPMVVDVQGETLRLTGTAEAQYESWRKLLREIYETETGLTESIQVGNPERSALPQQPSG
ncbi:MAG: hypothetical protein O3A13_06325 [Proteobacteria bacterium]|nr:hypothetical protein [Pseudomonadota bacterium]MDA0993232.1 hypothetical protein [Pseudomonadota bacterium]